MSNPQGDESATMWISAKTWFINDRWRKSFAPVLWALVHLVFAAEARVTKIVYRCWSLFYDSGRIWNESGTAILNIFHWKSAYILSNPFPSKPSIVSESILQSAC